MSRLRSSNQWHSNNNNTNKNSGGNNGDPYPPWAYREFNPGVSKSELEEERDGALMRRETTIRFLKLPFAFEECWAPVPILDKDGKIQRYKDGRVKTKRRLFKGTAGHAGFNGRDVYMEHFKMNIEPLREQARKAKRGEAPPVSSEQWKAAFEQAPSYEKRMAFELVDFQYHHFLKTDNNKAVLVPHVNRNCPLCKSDDPYIAEKRFGGRKYWSMTKAVFSSFEAEESGLGIYAKDTEGNVIECIQGEHLIGMVCPDCGHQNISQEDLANATNQQVALWTDKEYVCKNCKRDDVFLRDIMIDGVESRLSFLDVTWKIEWSANRTTRNGRSSTSNSRIVFTPIIPDKISPLLDAGDFGPLPGEIASPEWGNLQPNDLGVPYDLSFCYRPEPRSSITNSKIDPKAFPNREAYCQSVFESQAYVLMMNNPFPNVGGEEEEEFDTIPF